MEDEKLLKKIKKNKEYFNKVYRDNYSKIYNYIYSKISSKENSEDLASLVFEKALKGIDSFQWEGVSIESWLYRIARNTIIDYYRRENKRKGIVSFSTKIGSDSDRAQSLEETVKSGDPHIEDELFRSDEETTLYNILMKFDEKDQYLIYYKYFEDMSNKQIASVMEMSETNVGTRLQRLREKIKIELQKYETINA